MPPGWTWMFFFYDVLCVMLFSLGIGSILSILYVFFADVRHLYGVFLTLLMYLSAIFYPVSRLPGWMQMVLGYNPVYLFIYILRTAIMENQVPQGGVLAEAGLIAAVVFGFGLLVFQRKQNDVMIHI